MMFEVWFDVEGKTKVQHVYAATIEYLCKKLFRRYWMIEQIFVDNGNGKLYRIKNRKLELFV